MQTKLTLRLGDELSIGPKHMLKRVGSLFHRLWPDFFSLLNAEPGKEASEFTPLVQSLKGSLKGARVGKKDYHKYLEEKSL
jgi:hypothetical protein